MKEKAVLKSTGRRRVRAVVEKEGYQVQACVGAFTYNYVTNEDLRPSDSGAGLPVLK